MDWKFLFTSFSGRINRKPYWICTLIILGAILLIGVVGGFLLAAGGGEGGMGFVILVVAMTIATIYPALAVTVKRLHDRNKSAWWLIPFYLLPGALDGIGTAIGGEEGLLPLSLASMALGIWALVELGFLKGTQGPNEYGPDPLGAQQADASL